MTPASTAIFVLFDCPAFSTNVIPFTFKITLMTGSAEWRVTGRGIDKRSGYYTAVAGATRWVDPVIARVVPLSIMAEAGRRPAVG